MPTLEELTATRAEKPKPEPKRRTIWSVAEAIEHLSKYPMDDLVVSMVVVPRKKEEPRGD